MYYINTQELTSWQINHLSSLCSFYSDWQYNVLEIEENRLTVNNIFRTLNFKKGSYANIKEITYTELIQLLNKEVIYECW
jgi:hypothetical protein